MGLPMENKAQNPHESVYDVIVIGAGIIGAMIARELTRYKGRFALLEKESSTGWGVSKANPSMLHSPLLFPSGPIRQKCVYNASARYRRLATELDVIFREVDEIFVATDSTQLEKLEKAKDWAEENRLSAGHVIIGPEKLWELEPQVTRKAIGALYGKGVIGGIYAPEWTFALTENARQNGLDLSLNTPVIDIRTSRDSTYKVLTPRGALRTKYIVNAAGLFVDEVARMVGDGDIELTLTKATMVILDKSASYLAHNMIYGTYGKDHSQVITPTAHGNLMLGLGYFTVPKHKGDTAVSSEKIQQVIEMVKEIIPAVSRSHMITSFAGIRSENNKAAAPGDFYISPSGRAPGVIHAVIGSPGLTAAPSIAEMIPNLLSEIGMKMELREDFQAERKGWGRFGEASISKREEMIRSDPRYGHVVCRCEQVTAAEILEAIRRGAKTLDDVKHLTRAGMGRCQGGFCGVNVLKKLSMQLGILPSDVTKKGEGSNVILGLTKATGKLEEDFKR